MASRLVFIGLFGLAACNGSSGPNTPSQPPSVQPQPTSSRVISFTDPVGDLPGPCTTCGPCCTQRGRVDVTRMEFEFDRDTGNYEVTLTADSARPFMGAFRINLNLFNPDTGSGSAENPSFFQDTLNDFTLSASQTTVSLTGTNPRLRAWDAGHRVATGTVPLGNPNGSTFFRSSVGDLPLGGFMEEEDNIAFGDVATIRRP